MACFRSSSVIQLHVARGCGNLPAERGRLHWVSGCLVPEVLNQRAEEALQFGGPTQNFSCAHFAFLMFVDEVLVVIRDAVNNKVICPKENADVLYYAMLWFAMLY